jgi:hypothetical protein
MGQYNVIRMWCRPVVNACILLFTRSFEKNLKPAFLLHSLVARKIYDSIIVVIIFYSLGARDSVVGIVTTLRAGQSEIRIPTKSRDFVFSEISRPAVGFTQPPIQWVPGSLSAALKRPRCEVDHWPSSSVEAKNDWSYTSISSVWFNGVYRVNFIFYFIFSSRLLRNYTVCIRKIYRI